MRSDEAPKPRGRRTGSTDSGDDGVSPARTGAEQTSDRLESWKEVAEFLNKGVRTVMRWEELGLPVHRVPGAKRGRIVASRTEISQWLRGRPDLEQENAAPPIMPPSVAEADGGRSRSRGKRYLAGVLGGSVLLIVIVGTVLLSFPAPNPLARVSFLADAIQASGRDGRTLWTHHFSGTLDPNAIFDTDRFLRVGDLLGDGHREVLVAATVQTRPDPQFKKVEVDTLSESGRLRWSHTPQVSFRFGDREFSGPWMPYDVHVSRRGPPYPIYVAFDQTPWGYSFVTEINPATGNGTTRFVNSGSIRTLNEFSASQKTYLLVGGFNNEFDGGSLAIFDESRSFAASPQTAGTHHACASCPPGRPDYYLVFPRSELNRLRQVYETPVRGVNVTGDQLEVTVLELLPSRDLSARYLLGTEPTLHMLSLRFDSGYEMLHHHLEQTGELDHPLSNCPERLHPAPVRVWTPSTGWSEWDVKPVSP